MFSWQPLKVYKQLCLVNEGTCHIYKICTHLSHVYHNLSIRFNMTDSKHKTHKSLCYAKSILVLNYKITNQITRFAIYVCWFTTTVLHGHSWSQFCKTQMTPAYLHGLLCITFQPPSVDLVVQEVCVLWSVKLFWSHGNEELGEQENFVSSFGLHSCSHGNAVCSIESSDNCSAWKWLFAGPSDDLLRTSLMLLTEFVFFTADLQ